MLGANSTIKTQRLSETDSKESYPSGVYNLTDISVYIEQVNPETAVTLDSQNAYDLFSMIAVGINEVIATGDALYPSTTLYPALTLFPTNSSSGKTSDIKTGDKVIDQDDVEYIVKGIMYLDNNSEMANQYEIIMVKTFTPD